MCLRSAWLLKISISKFQAAICVSSLTLLVGRQKEQEHQACKKNWVVGYWRGYLTEARCRLAYPSGCHCHSLSLASVKSRLVFPFWYRMTRVVPDKGPLNGCVCVYYSHKGHSRLSVLVNIGGSYWLISNCCRPDLTYWQAEAISNIAHIKKIPSTCCNKEKDVTAKCHTWSAIGQLLVTSVCQ